MVRRATRRNENQDAARRSQPIRIADLAGSMITLSGHVPERTSRSSTRAATRREAQGGGSHGAGGALARGAGPDSRHAEPPTAPRPRRQTRRAAATRRRRKPRGDPGHALRLLVPTYRVRREALDEQPSPRPASKHGERVTGATPPAMPWRASEGGGMSSDSGERGRGRRGELRGRDAERATSAPPGPAAARAVPRRRPPHARRRALDRRGGRSGGPLPLGRLPVRRDAKLTSRTSSCRWRIARRS